MNISQEFWTDAKINFSKVYFYDKFTASFRDFPALKTGQ